MKFSLHNHCNTPDIRITLFRDVPVQRIVDRMFQKKIDAVALTNTNSDVIFGEIAEHPRKYLPKYVVHNLNDRVLCVRNDDKWCYLLKGLEFHKPDGHVIGLGYTGSFGNVSRENETLDERIHMIKDRGGIALATHPLVHRAGGMGDANLHRYVDQLDAMEVFNALAVFPLSVRNWQAKWCSVKYSIPGIATADSHDGAIETAYFETQRHIPIISGEHFIESLRDVLKDNDFENHRKYISHYQFVKQYPLKILINKLKRI